MLQAFPAGSGWRYAPGCPGDNREGTIRYRLVE